MTTDDEREREEGIDRSLDVICANIALRAKINALYVPQQQVLAQAAELIAKDAELDAAQVETIEPYLDSVDAHQELEALQQELQEAQQRARRTSKPNYEQGDDYV